MVFSELDSNGDGALSAQEINPGEPLGSDAAEVAMGEYVIKCRFQSNRA